MCILDEADSMTIDAQAALRRIIEAHAQTTRFCIICNYIAKIIDPLASRCVKFRFSHIEGDAQKQRLSDICTQEGIRIESEAVLETLINVSDGDLRRSINLLQTCASFIKVDGGDGVLTVSTIQQVSGVVPQTFIDSLVMRLFEKSKGYSHIQDIAEEITLEGYDTQQLLTDLLEAFIAIEDTKMISDL